MTSPKPSLLPSLSLRQRLGLVALLCALLCLIPTLQLGMRLANDLSVVGTARAGLPANKVWQQALTALNAHRLAAAALQARPETEPARQVLAGQADQAFGALADSLQRTGFADSRVASVQALREEFASLSAAIGKRELDFPALLARQQQLALRIFDEINHLNADAGLLLDPQAPAYFSVIAGLQIAPRIGDALSELGAIANAAAIDDVARVAATAARYNADSHQLQHNLELAARLDPARAENYEQSRRAAAQQQAMVNAALEASAKDVNYPLDKMSAAFAQAAQLQSEVSAKVLESVDARLSERESTLQQSTALTAAVIVLGLLAVGLLLWRTIAGILRPVLQAVEVTEKIAGGDLSSAVVLGRRDEMWRVLNAISGMQQRLRGLVHKLQEAAGEIHQAADEVSAGNQDLSQRSEQSAVRMQVAAGTVEQLSLTVGNTAQAADAASQLAQSASQAAAHGCTVVSQFLLTMQSISSGSHKIADIIGVIDSIAFQTNILALNAAVEAARAGEQGRGFAVVASEVRALAQRSASAAREIKTLIGASVEQVETGSRQIDEAKHAMSGIARNVERVTGMISGIAGDAKQESARMHELSQVIAEIDRMTQQNAALVEQSAAAAQSMNQQAEQMFSLAGEFRLQQ
jgi:methyl-accepting chemotaxis protein